MRCGHAPLQEAHHQRLWLRRPLGEVGLRLVAQGGHFVAGRVLQRVVPRYRAAHCHRLPMRRRVGGDDAAVGLYLEGPGERVPAILDRETRARLRLIPVLPLHVLRVVGDVRARPVLAFFEIDLIEGPGVLVQIADEYFGAGRSSPERQRGQGEEHAPQHPTPRTFGASPAGIDSWPGHDVPPRAEHGSDFGFSFVGLQHQSDESADFPIFPESTV